MSAPDCSTCALAGYRSCDRCGGVVFEPSAFTRGDLCQECAR